MYIEVEWVSRSMSKSCWNLGIRYFDAQLCPCKYRDMGPIPRLVTHSTSNNICNIWQQNLARFLVHCKKVWMEVLKNKSWTLMQMIFSFCSYFITQGGWCVANECLLPLKAIHLSIPTWLKNGRAHSEGTFGEGWRRSGRREYVYLYLCSRKTNINLLPTNLCTFLKPIPSFTICLKLSLKMSLQVEKFASCSSIFLASKCHKMWRIFLYTIVNFMALTQY